MAGVEHRRPEGSEGGLARVLFEIEDKSLGDVEVLWGERTSDEAIRLDNIPLLVFGVSMGDTIRVRRDGDGLWSAGGLERGGHSTYRVMLRDATDKRVQDAFRHLVTLGCGYEELTRRYVAVDVPPDVDVRTVYDALEQGLEQDFWTFEEGHCGHRLDRPSR
jgi:Domain of unknown function (DUF4265)